MKIKLIEDKKTWENFIFTSKNGNFLQSWNWGEFNRRIGHKIYRFGLYRKNKLKGVFLLIEKNAKRGRYLECPGGPLILESYSSNLEFFVNQIKEIGKQEHCLFARVRPQLLDNPKNRYLFKKNGFVNSPMHLHAENTWQLKLNKKPKQLLMEMRKSRRYEIRKAKRDGVKITRSQDTEDIKQLYQLQLETAKRQAFVPFSKTYMKTQFEIFTEDDQAVLYKAYYKKKLLAISFFIFYNKEAVYHYSATASRHRKVPASQRVLWEAILEAQKRGHKYFNFWGIAPKDREDDHRFSGVTFFKKGFGGHRVDYLHAQDLPMSFRYWPVYLFESYRKWKRGL
jgi:lipid II:glycine glycyltransferase (peptidoglycan interpeptide bridge formation enzyme)